jgi:S-formylglutathione hydrolase
MNKSPVLIIILVIILMASSCAKEDPIDILDPKGVIIRVDVHSPGLEGNLLDDSPLREVSIYLPPGYEDDEDKRYPVIYFLHGFLQDNRKWTGSDGLVNTNFAPIMNTLINNDEIDPMIIVIPNSKNSYDGSWYTNSPTTGNWEDFIVKDVVQYVDENYRTIPERGSRGIAGHSMGGYGTFKLAMRNPGIFSSAYMLSASFLVFEDVVIGTMRTFMGFAACANSYSGLYWETKAMIAAAAAFAPDSAATFYGQFPLTCSGDTIVDIWEEWLQHDPHTLLTAYEDSLLKLSAIQFDCGNADAYLFQANKRIAQALSSFENVHFEEYPGDHTSELAIRVEEELLPFFSRNLIHDEK